MQHDQMESLRILVVEDDATVGSLLCEMLETMGHEVCARESTQANAVRAAARHRPGFMIVDAGLWGGAGMATVAEVLRNGAMPYLFTTCDRLRLRTLQPSAVMIQKPFHEAELARAIGLALDVGAPARKAH